MCGNNILDTTVSQNCHLTAESFPSIYILIDHEATRLSLWNPVSETKPLIQQNFESFGKADHDAKERIFIVNAFCYRKIN